MLETPEIYLLAKGLFGGVFYIYVRASAFLGM